MVKGVSGRERGEEKGKEEEGEGEEKLGSMLN